MKIKETVAKYRKYNKSLLSLFQMLTRAL